MAADKPCPQLQPSLVALTRKIQKVIEKLLNCSINLMHFEISQDFRILINNQRVLTTNSLDIFQGYSYQDKNLIYKIEALKRYI